MRRRTASDSVESIYARPSNACFAAPAMSPRKSARSAGPAQITHYTARYQAPLGVRELALCATNRLSGSSVGWPPLQAVAVFVFEARAAWTSFISTDPCEAVVGLRNQSRSRRNPCASICGSISHRPPIVGAALF